MRSSHAGLVVVVSVFFAPMTFAQEPTSQMDEIQRVIRESEYHVTWQDQTVLPDLEAVWHAANRGQNLRFYFTDDGLRVVDRTAEGSPELLRLAVAGFVASDTQPVIFGAAENRLEISRGELTESFVNDESGLWHILAINDPPPGDGSVSIELDWSAAGMNFSPRAVEFQAQTGRRLVYSLDKAFDAAGSSVETALSSRGGRLLLTFNAPFVVYPVTIKNLITGTADTVLEGNVAGTALGAHVASGDFNGDGFADVAAGAPFWDGGQAAEGAVFVFHGGPGGIQSNGSSSIAVVADAIIESNVSGFNWPVSLSAVGDINGDGYDDLAAGETWWDPVNPPSTTRLFGAVWIFEGSASGITAAGLDDADTRIVSDVLGAAFGISVDAAGDVNGDGYGDLIAGAWLWSDDPAQTQEGAAFVFHGSSSGVVATSITEADTVVEGNGADLWSSSTTVGLGDVNGDGFGDVAVNIFGLAHPELFEGGIAILHGGSAGIAGNPTQALIAAADSLIEGNLAYNLMDEFAPAGDVNGDGYADLILGSSGWEDSAPHADEGVVVIYHGGASGIPSNQTASFTDAADTVIEGNPSPHLNIQFGDRVMTAGDVNGDGYADVVAGANRYENGELSEGAFFVFHGGAGGIPSSRTDPVDEVADVVIERNMAGLYLGGIRPGSGDVNGDGFSDLIVSAHLYTSPQPTEGALFIYHGAAEMLAEEPAGQYFSSQAVAALGAWVGSAGDVNGDGFVDLAVGAPWFDGGQQDSGRTFVFHGSAGPFLSSPDWTADGTQASGDFGASVASAGDVNGDGFGDLAVGSPYFSNGEHWEGRVDVFQGSASGLSTGPDWSFECNSVDATLGRSVASAGDIDGDGYADLIAGAPLFSDGQLNEGRAYVFFGSTDGLPTTPDWTFDSDVAGAYLGVSVSGAGDVDGDGLADVVVGAWHYESGQTAEGAAYAFAGSPQGLPVIPDWFIETNRPNAGYGYSVAAAGDVNGDGFGDVVVGAPYDTNPESTEGRAYVYFGSTSGLSTSADQILERNTAGANFGLAVASAGDVNGDGFADLVIGSPNYPSVAAPYGRAELFLGSGGGVADQPAWTIDGGYAPSGLGSALAGIGDHNGDGFSDVAVGLRWHSAGFSVGGSVELYLGNEGAGRPVLARQFRGADDPTPVQPWGLAHSGDEFQVSVTATSPRGRELAKLHVEACPPGEVWGDIDCRHQVSVDWTEIPLGESGVVLTETISSLTEGELYNWRAHVLYLPVNGDEPGITPPTVPRHGVWRRLFAMAPAADIRVGEPQSITIEVVNAMTSVSESAAQAGVDVVVTTSDGAVTEVGSSVDYQTYDGTAIAGQDYVHTSWNLLFPAGTASGAVQSIQVDLIGDDLDEPDEDFSVEITNPMGAVLGAQTAHTVTILDDDPPPELSAVDIQIDEGAGLAIVTLELSGPTTYEVTVNYTTLDGTAVAPEDYGPASGIATLPPMDTTATVEIPIADDGLDEINETFTLELSGASNASLMTPSVVVTILDDDPPPELSAVNVDVGEGGGTATVTLELSAPTSFEVTVNYSTADGTAVAPEDYGPVSGTATIPPMDTTVTVEIPIADDGLDEIDETFTLELSGASNASLTTPSVVVTILDDDPPPELSAVNVDVGEGAGTATVTLELSAPTSFEVTVGYSTADGTAVAPEDYGMVSGTATLPPMDTTATVEIPIADDGLDEINETFTLELSGASNASLTTPSAAVTILDDDPPPELSTADVGVDEGAGIAVVVLVLSAPSSFEVTVDYATADGSAVAPEDYGPVNGTATIPPMDTIFNIEIPIEDDWLEEPPEFFTLDLTSPANAALVTPMVTITIMDDDAGIIFGDGFESGDPGRWTSVTP